MAHNEQNSPTDEEMKMMQETEDAETADSTAAATPEDADAGTADDETADSTAEDKKGRKKKPSFMQQLRDYVDADEDAPLHFT